MPGGATTVEQTLADAGTAPVSDEMRALLDIAGLVQVSGRMVTADAVVRRVPRHDRVRDPRHRADRGGLSADRYVDGFGAFTDENPAEYAAGARFLVEHGYRTPR